MKPAVQLVPSCRSEFKALELVHNTEFVNRCLAVSLPRLQHSGGKRRLVRRVGMVLCLETKGTVLAEPTATGLAVEKVPRVELEPWLSRSDFHSPTGLWAGNRGRQAQAILLICRT